MSVLRLPCIRDVSVVLLTRNAAFAAAESLTQLRLLDKGVPKQVSAPALVGLMGSSCAAGLGRQ